MISNKSIIVGFVKSGEERVYVSGVDLAEVMKQFNGKKVRLTVEEV